ncbi:family 20 glycosylhydrolase [Pseudactinotalea sp. HY160]|uniref:family 20 glycosylhydrolase n=1 Tax=Pseudactinotalea sp. HY160 TaxID=2654490 RepID=UPI00128D44D5|nr:family 20 glycosylhydrolase [Pseudactinotalea sp. HY160]MPV50529.1 family 20 glycosylhydrolase [Pseudactinotalea sp. HY160]
MTNQTLRAEIAHGRASTVVLAATASLALAGAMVIPAAADTGDPENLSLASIVTASGQEVGDRWGPRLTIDGDHGPAENRSDPTVHNAPDSSRWSANNSDDAWIDIHFAQESAVSEVAVDWGNTFGDPYALSISEDGVRWEEIATGITGVRDGIVVTELDEPATGSHLRLQISGKSQQWALAIWEIEVLGTPIGQPPVDAVPLDASLVPLPLEATATGGTGFTLAADSCLSLSDASLEAVADRLREAIGTSTGLTLPTGQDCAVSLAIDESLSVGAGRDEEAYTLDVDENGVRIVAHSPRAALWAVRTLVQLLGPWAQAPVALDVAPTLEAVHIEDAPRYAWRGLMLDPARSFWPVEEVEELIDLISQFKLNVLHVHLSDDQGWRIAVDNEGRADADTIDYSQLTERSGATAYMAGKSNYAPAAGRTGFYTRAEFSGLVAYAAERGVMVVPEIDGPGHANSMLHAIDELNTAGAFPKPAAGNTRVDAFDESTFAQTTLDPRSEATYTFLTHVLSQLVDDTIAGVAAAEGAGAALAPASPYLHIGGDESATTTGDDYAHYMERVTEIVTETGRLPIVWNEATSTPDALPDGTVVQQWNGGISQGTRDLVENRGGKILLSQVGNAYYPQIPTTDLSGPSWACGGTACGIDDFYNWNPTSMAGVDEAGVLGVEGPMWSEHLRTLHDLQFLVFPRLLAHAEVGWTPQARRSFADFTGRVPAAGVSLLTQDATFQLVPEVTDWYSSFAPAPVADVSQAGGEVLVGYVAAPGTAEVADATVTATLAGVDVPVRLAMERGFHYTDEGRTTGRVMNSLIEVYAQLPEFAEAGTYELAVRGTVPVGEVAGTVIIEVAAEDGGDTDTGADGDAGTGGSDAGGSSDAGAGADSGGADSGGADAAGTETGADPESGGTEAAAAATSADAGSDAAEGVDDGADPAPGAMPDTGVQPTGIALAALLLIAGAVFTLRRRAAHRS